MTEPLTAAQEAFLAETWDATWMTRDVEECRAALRSLLDAARQSPSVDALAVLRDVRSFVDEEPARPGAGYHFAVSQVRILDYIDSILARLSPAPAREGTRLDHHALTHLIAKARGREDAIDLDDNRLAEVLIAEMKAAGADVDWTGPDPDHYTAETRALLRPAPEAGGLRAAMERIEQAADALIDEHLDKAHEYDFGFPAVLVDDIRSAIQRVRAALKESGS